NQQFAQHLEVARRHGLAVDPAAAAAFAGDQTADNALAIGVQLVFGKPGAGAGGIGDVEACGNVGAVAAVAHGVGVGAVAQDQVQRVDQNRLAGARFAG